jgi:putative ABC transport system substrate-binding protein
MLFYHPVRSSQHVGRNRQADLLGRLQIDDRFIEGKNILVEYRYAGGTSEDRVQDLVAETVQLKVDVLASPATSVIRAAKQATKVIPIVMVITADPVETGLVVSLARPGGNVTGA